MQMLGCYPMYAPQDSCGLMITLKSNDYPEI